MMPDYTLLLLAPNRPTRAQRVSERIHERAVALGLRPEALVTCEPETYVGGRGPMAAVYFGGAERRDASSRLAAELVNSGQPVLPVVPTLDGYTAQVPPALHGVNGLADDGTDARLDEIANCLLAALGLVRRHRRIFISYRRKESTGVARQLAAALPAAGWTVFLDTQSVERGVMFQHVLWDAMADTDLVIFLDTPSVLESHWVAQEFARANEQGITLLRLVWPGRQRVREFELSESLPLKPEDFATGYPHTRPSGRLRRPGVRCVVDTLEHLRAEAFAARRRRVVEAFVRRIRRHQAAVNLQPSGSILVERRDGRSALVMPVIGSLESLHFEHAHRLIEGPNEVRVLYDALGLHPDRIRHLEWLDAHLPVKKLALDGVPAWMNAP